MSQMNNIDMDRWEDKKAKALREGNTFLYQAMNHYEMHEEIFVFISTLETMYHLNNSYEKEVIDLHKRSTNQNVG